MGDGDTLIHRNHPAVCTIAIGMTVTQVLSDSFVGLSIAGAAYEIVALLFKVFPPITSLAREWRKKPAIFLILVPYIGLGWHLFIQ